MAEAKYFAKQGITYPSIKGLFLFIDPETTLITPETSLELTKVVDPPDANAEFLSCSVLRSIEILNKSKKQLGKPVLSSNQVSMWHCLRLTDIED